MRVEYDPERDLLYIWFKQEAAKAARTVTVAPGVHADLDSADKLVGIEVLDATEVLGRKVEFEVALPSGEAAKVARAA